MAVRYYGPYKLEYYTLSTGSRQVFIEDIYTYDWERGSNPYAEVQHWEWVQRMREMGAEAAAKSIVDEQWAVPSIVRTIIANRRARETCI